jgi:signal transduction histidine kinase/ActR/RegA family two-component response regulator
VSPETSDESLDAFITLGDSLTGIYHPESVVQRFIQAFEQLLSPDQFLVVLTDPLGLGSPLLVESRAWPNAGLQHPAVQLVQRQGSMIVPPLADIIRESWPGAPPSWMGASLKAAHHELGVVVLGSLTPNRFQEKDLKTLRAILVQAAIALINAHLLRLLESGKREWEQTVDAIPDAFCIVGSRGNVRRANKAFASLVQVPVSALVDQPWHKLVPQEWNEPIARALATPGSNSSKELKLGERLFAASAHPMGTDGENAVLVLADQTDKRALQDQVVQSAKMSAIGQLIAGIAHDLNNPLASVVGFAEYLVDAVHDVPARLLEPLRAIHQEAERASKIVRNLLAFARKQEGDRHPLAIGYVLEATVLLLKNQLMAYRVDVDLNVADNLPPIEGNANQLQQVFVNVITNAAQAIHGSRTGGRIAVAAEKWLDGVAVTVQDDGPGIADTMAERIFEPFFTTKPEGEGTGLGLTICHGIVTEHGGKITLVDQGAGSAGATFRIELPGGLIRAIADERATTHATGLHILVVDDEPHILHYMRAALEDWGHHVSVAVDGRQALEIAPLGGFDVIITDLRMPRLGGRDFFEALARDHPDLAKHVVFCTGDTVAGDALRFLESVRQPHLKKPFTLSELRSILPKAAQGST